MLAIPTLFLASACFDQRSPESAEPVVASPSFDTRRASDSDGDGYAESHATSGAQSFTDPADRGFRFAPQHHSEWAHLVPDMNDDGAMDIMSSVYFDDEYAEFVDAFSYGTLSSQYAGPDYGPRTVYLGWSASPVGDLTGDGLPEILTFQSPDDYMFEFAETVSLYDGLTVGSADTLADDPVHGNYYFTPSEALRSYDMNCEYFARALIIGDLDGDDVQEVIIRATDTSYAFPVSALTDPDYDICDAAPWRVELPISEAPWRDAWGRGVGSYGITRADVDGDGIDELFTGQRWYWGEDLRTPGAYGSADAMTLASLGEGYADCERVGPAGDVDGDGHPAIFAACGTSTGPGEIRVVSVEPRRAVAPSEVLGPPDVRAMLTPPWAIYRPHARVQGTTDLPLGVHALSPGDPDGDGRDELVLATAESTSASILLVVPGAQLSAGTVLTDDVQRRVSVSDGEYFVAGMETGDVTGDGRPDVVAYPMVHDPMSHVEYTLGSRILPFEDILP
jgi:hypothetical protein